MAIAYTSCYHFGFLNAKIMYFLQHYKIDFDKVQTIDDIKRLLKAIDIGFEPNNPNIKDIEDLVKLEDKPSYGNIPLSNTQAE